MHENFNFEQLPPPEDEPSAMKLLRALWATEAGRDARFTNTGGNCMAVEVAGDDWEVLVTDVNGPLERRSLETDEGRSGWCIGRAWADGSGNWTQQEEPIYVSEDLEDLEMVVTIVIAYARHPER